jgi:hypothetical protein
MFNRLALLVGTFAFLAAVAACSTTTTPLDFPNGKDKQPVNTGLPK